MALDVCPERLKCVPVELWVRTVSVDIECLDRRLENQDLAELLIQAFLDLLVALGACDTGQQVKLAHVGFGSDAIDVPVIEPEPLDRHPQKSVVRMPIDRDNPGEVKSEVDGL